MRSLVPNESPRMPRLLTLLALATGCSFATPPLNPGAEDIPVSRDSPGPGWTVITPFQVAHGLRRRTCGGPRRGTREGAHALARNRALELGGQYVMIVSEGPTFHDCDTSYRLQGVAFTRDATAGGSTCAPPCSPGFGCDDAGVCRPLCNPPCSPGFECNDERVCMAEDDEVSAPPETDSGAAGAD